MKNSLSPLMCAIFIVSLLSHATYSQITRVEPAQPRWGQTITIIYDPKAEGARFKPADEVYLNLYLGYYDAPQEIFAKMNKAGEQFKIASYPTHVIIDRAGAVEAVMTGGSEKRHEDIRPLIARLLKSN